MATLIKKQKNGSAFPSLVNDFFNANGFFSPSIFENNFFDFDRSLVVPEVNVIENDKDYQIELAAPGLERKDFQVEIQDGVLSISAQKEEEKKEEKKNFRRREFSYNSFSRAFTLPNNLISDKVDAKYENGVLHISLPKKEVTLSKPVKQIPVT